MRTALTLLGMVFMYLLPLVVIIVTYTIILLTIRRKSRAGAAAAAGRNQGAGGKGVYLHIFRTGCLRSMAMTYVCTVCTVEIVNTSSVLETYI